MKRKILLPLLVILVLLVAGPVAAQSSESIEARLIVPEGQMTVGDPIEVILTVTYPEGYQVILPQFESPWGEFVVESQSVPETTANRDSTLTTSQVIDLRLFAPGTYSTPSVTLTVTDGLGGVTEVLAAPVEVNISSVLVEGDTELRDIKPQVELPFTNLLPWIVAGVLLLLGGFVLFLFIRWQKRRRALAALDRRLPHEVALDDLAHIEGIGLPDQGRFKEYYTLISDVMRTYMEKRFKVAMLERTTAEIEDSLIGIEIEANVAGQYLSLLDICDLVKFSKYSPEVDSAYSLMISARQIVTSTIPLDETAEQGNDSQEDKAEFNDELQSGPNLSNNGNYRQTEVSA